MDLTKANAAIANARAEVKTIVDQEIAARRFNSLRFLGAADEMLEKAGARLTKAATPKAKKEKKDKKDKK